MNSELIVLTFAGERDASKAESALRLMREQKLLGLHYAASLSKDSAGSSEMRLRLMLPANIKDDKLWLLCQFANSFCGTDEQSLELLVGAGMDRTFLESLREEMAPDTSALLIYAPAGSPADLQIVQTVLSLFQGKLFDSFPETVGKAVLARILSRAEC